MPSGTRKGQYRKTARKAYTKAKKRGRRYYGRARARAPSKKQAIAGGRSALNIGVGSALIAGTSRVVGPQTARLGIYAQPINLIIAGLAGTYVFKSGQKDLISAGMKIGGSRVLQTQIVPRLEGMAPRTVTGTRTVTRRTTNGGYV